MKASFKTDSKASYLDVTQFIIKQCSPLIKPSSPKMSFHDQKYQKTPQINPIDHDPSKFTMTPLCKGLCAPQIYDIMQEFNLDGIDNTAYQGKHESKSKSYRNKEHRPRSMEILEIFHIQQDALNMIPELQNEDQACLYYGDDYEYSSDQYESYSDEYSSTPEKEQEGEKQSTIQMSTIQLNDTIERFKQNPKKQIIKHMKEIQNNMPEESEEGKKELIKHFIEKYLLDYETYCYQEAWQELHKYDLSIMIKKIAEGLSETFSKKIGQLPFQIRRTKILKYLQKKKKRIWRKKVSYDCRKKVADGRLRIKGKFVTRQQACQQLGVDTLEGYTSEEIKCMLQRRLDKENDS